jgi:hypothetical protein
VASVFAHVAVRQHVVDRLLAGPTLGVDAGVDHQAHRAQHLVVERAEPLIGILVEAHVVAQRLRIERPAFDEGRVPPKRMNGGSRLFSCARLIWKWWPGEPS